ncbi:MAG: glutamate-5-semialdehyde dehydrogenase [Nannocystaceae bacterium]
MNDATPRDRALAARKAAPALIARGPAGRAAILADLAAELEDMSVRTGLLAANREDLDRAAHESVAPARQARLGLAAAKLDGLADGLRQLAAAADRVGAITLRRELDEGLVLTRERCPLGTLGVVFEARPDAVIQIAGLAIKSGNALLLKGGSEARSSNAALVAVIHRVLARHGLDPALVANLERRDDFAALLDLEGVVDLIIARGGASFVHQVMERSKIPVMGHAEGLCHVVLGDTAAPAMAARILVDAKGSYPAACNAVETLLWTPGAGAALDASVAALAAAGVELRGCAATRARHPAMIAATDDDWATEYGALILSIRGVPDLDAALDHIERFGSGHTEAIVTDDAAEAERFLAAVDAASIFHNASTRFADGYRYGLGAEVGISTQKLHARGPVGVDGLLTERWLLRGRGQVSTDYGPGKRAYTHRDLDPEG